uniref:TAR DNA-binding protein 43 N-terminal domain-containing protein n=2 Tax=Parascaris univalens TaxID=6257 RepID=A0A915C2V1_PARUN
RIEQAASSTPIAPEREFTPSEEELRMLQAKLRNAVEKSELLQNQLDDARMQIDYMQQQADSKKYRESIASSGEKSPVGIETSSISPDEVNELSEELIRVSRNKYELQEKIKRIEMEAQVSKERVLYLEGETRRMGEQLWLANERVANQDRELGDLHGQVSWLRSENERLGREMEEEKRKFLEAGGIDYSKYDEMRQAEERLRDEKSKVEWHLGEVTQWWNDAKWRIGELEAGMAHRQWLLDQANQKVFELSSEHESLRQFRDKAKDTLDGTFLIRKQPVDGRYKWRLAMWDENSPDDLKDYRRVWFETTAPNAKRVFLSASFVNWECALLCDNFDKENGKFGVWVDIPPGRYEFLFIVDGEWTTCDGYPTVTNEFGSQNNWRYID